MQKDELKRALAFLLTAYGAGVYGNPNVLGSASTSKADVAKSVAAQFQGFNQENFMDVLVYQTALAVKANVVIGPGFPAAPPSTGFDLNSLVNGYWGNPAGVVDAQDVEALLKYGALIQLGCDLSKLV